MRRFRSSIAVGMRLALAALAVPLGLLLACSAGAAHAAPAIRPVPSTATRTGKDCTICAVMTLADKVIFATPPLLMLPEAVDFLYRTTDAEFIHLKSARIKSAGATAQPPAHHAS
jgi:hypothetical protein